MQKREVVILTGIYPPDSGGPATFAVTFSQFLENLEYGYRVISLTNRKSIKTKRVGVQISLTSRNSNLVIRTIKIVSQILSEFLKGSRIIANGFFIETYLASLITGKVYVAKIPGDIVWERATNSKVTDLDVKAFQSSKLGLKYRIFRTLFSRSLQRASSVIAPSALLYELCLEWGVKTEKLFLIYNSVDVNYFVPNEQAEKVFDCVVVNRLVTWKNVPEVIRTCSIAGLSLLIIGDGPERENLLEFSKEFGSQTIFAGNATPPELLNYLQSSKYYILNSSFDATAYSLLEARSCGLIAIANCETGASEVIHHKEDGFLTNGTSEKDLVDALTWLSERNPIELRQMSDKARKSTEVDFNRDINFKKILHLVVG